MIIDFKEAFQRRPRSAARGSRVGLELSRAAGDRTLEVMSLNDVGWSHAPLGDYQRAIIYCERALAGSQERGERNWEGAAWHSLGYVHHQLGNHQRAIACYERSLDLCRELADRYNEADTLDHLGGAHSSVGDIGAAHWAWTQALRMFDEIDHPGGDRVRHRMMIFGSCDRSGECRSASQSTGGGTSLQTDPRRACRGERRGSTPGLAGVAVGMACG
jgi:tetratricopeptide (TPR) repeat protein